MKTKTLYYLIKSALENETNKELVVEFNNQELKVWGIRSTADRLVLQATEEKE